MRNIVVISDEEHIAFFLLWLCYSFLCNMSCCIGINYIPLANLLHGGKEVCLNKILLSSLYESLGDIYKSIKDSNSIPSNMTGPLWLLQMWLNVIYTHGFIAPPVIPGSTAPYGAYLAQLTH